MNLYRIGFENEDGMAWAGGYGPVEDLWFLHPKSLELKQAFWKINRREPGLSIDSGGKRWPDVLGCGFAPPTFFVSETVVGSLRSIGAPMGRVTEIPIARIDAKALKRETAPRYFVIETMPGIEVDLELTGFNLDAQGNPILNPPPYPRPSPYRYRLDTWNGTDLFAYRHFGPTDGPYIDMFCTERVKDLAKHDGWTNVRFIPLALV